MMQLGLYGAAYLIAVSFRRQVLTQARRFLRISSGAMPAHRKDTVEKLVYS